MGNICISCIFFGYLLAKISGFFALPSFSEVFTVHNKVRSYLDVDWSLLIHLKSTQLLLAIQVSILSFIFVIGLIPIYRCILPEFANVSYFSGQEYEF